MNEVYICYDERDKMTANAICHVLEENGMKCWIKSRDVGIKHITEEITDAIKRSKVMVLVFSENAKESNFVNVEVDIGSSLNLPMVVYNIDDSKLDGNLEDLLKEKHWLDAYPNPTSEFETLIKDTSKLLNKPIDKPVITPNIKISNSEDAEKNKINKKRIILIALIPILIVIIAIIIKFFELVLNLGSDIATIVLFTGFLSAIIVWPILIFYIAYSIMFN